MANAYKLHELYTDRKSARTPTVETGACPVSPHMISSPPAEPSALLRNYCSNPLDRSSPSRMRYEVVRFEPTRESLGSLAGCAGSGADCSLSAYAGRCRADDSQRPYPGHPAADCHCRLSPKYFGKPLP